MQFTPQAQSIARPRPVGCASTHWTGCVVLAVLVFSTNSCLPPPRRAFFASCATSDECESGVCHNSLCTASCVTSNTCAPVGLCVATYCTPQATQPCKLPTDCQHIAVLAGQAAICVGGLCALPAVVKPNCDDANPCTIDSRTAAGLCEHATQTTCGNAATTNKQKRVFVTSKTYTAALGGLAGADSICQALADAAKLGGVYRAWLSGPTAAPVNRFLQACRDGGPFVLVDGTVIAKDWAGLTSGTLAKGIAVTELGGPPPTANPCPNFQKSAAWTATLENGSANSAQINNSCAGWTTGAQTFTAQLAWGNPGATTAWSVHSTCTILGATGCAKLASLYCFEQ